MASEETVESLLLRGDIRKVSSVRAFLKGDCWQETGGSLLLVGDSRKGTFERGRWVLLGPQKGPLRFDTHSAASPLSTVFPALSPGSAAQVSSGGASRKHRGSVQAKNNRP